jgi:hypothetical protein
MAGGAEWQQDPERSLKPHCRSEGRGLSVVFGGRSRDPRARTTDSQN